MSTTRFTGNSVAQLSQKRPSHSHSMPGPVDHEIDISTSSGSSTMMALMGEFHNEESEAVLGRVKTSKSTMGRASRVAQIGSKGAMLIGSGRVSSECETAEVRSD